MKKSVKFLIKKYTKKLLIRFFSHEEVSEIIKTHYPPLQVIQGHLTFNKDGLATRHSSSFLNDKHFIESYKLGKATGSWGGVDIEWRAYIACWCASKASALEGDFVECGVNKGGLARTIIHYVDFQKLKKKFYLLDTFNGLVDEYISDEEKKMGILPGGYEECYEEVKRTFAGFNVKIIKGAVPETLSEVDTAHIAYLSIDMNCVAPEIAAAEFFWNKMISGAAMLLDDYGWSGHENQKEAFDDFCRQKGVNILALPTGQGIIFKP